MDTTTHNSIVVNKKYCGFCHEEYSNAVHKCFENFYRDILQDAERTFMYIQSNWSREKRKAISAMFKNEESIRKKRIYGG